MGKGVLAICDTDTAFAFRLMEYAAQKRKLPFEIRVFTSSETLSAFLREEVPEALLISEESMTEELLISGCPRRFLLGGSREHAAYGEWKHIYKYQAADDLLEEILDAYKTDGTRKERDPQSCRILGIFSPAALPEQILFSLALVQALARQKHILYLNKMEFSGLTHLVPIASERTIGDLMYMLRHATEEKKPVSAYVQRAFGADFIAPFQSAEDFWEITQEEWDGCLEYLIENGDYDWILVDFGSRFFEESPVFGRCSRIYMLEDERRLTRIRSDAFLQEAGQRWDKRIFSRIERVSLPPGMAEESFENKEKPDRMHPDIGIFAGGLANELCRG